MKKICLTMLAAAMLSTPAMATGFFYNDTVEPTALGLQNVSGCKVGKSSCNNYFGIVQLGDCSYEAAMRNGKITQVNHHDTYTKGWVFVKHITTRVYGN